MVGHANDEYQLIADQPGFVELVCETYWQAVLVGAMSAIARAGICAGDIVSISVCTQGETFIPIDKNGKALRNAIVWLDERASDQAKRLSERFNARRFYRETGLPELNGFTPIAKLLWLKENEPEVYQSTWKFLLLEDYILYRLTGVCVTEKALACGTGWFQFSSDNYWTEILDYAQLDAGKLPELLECGTIVPAFVLPEVRAKLGLIETVKVVTGAMDQTAGAVGADNLAPGVITETTGTAMCLVATLAKLNLDLPSHVTVYRHVTQNRYLMITISRTAGMFLKWFKDNFCELEQQKAEQEHLSVYAMFDEIVAITKPGANGLIAYPYLSGSLQPHKNSAVRGVFFGAGLDSKKAHFLRAIFEGIGFMLRENMELIEKVNDIQASEIRSLGGGSKSAVWMQIKADILKKPVGALAESECASLGVAILAAVALGYFESLETAAKLSNAVIDWKEPNEELAPLYDRTYDKYCALYTQLEPLF
jgi:xylulokinase